MLQPITSRDNDKIKQACRLRDSEAARAEAGLFFAEGPKLCLEAAKSCRCAALYATRRALEHTPALAALDAVTIPVSDPVADKLSSTKSSQGVFGLFALPAPDPAALDAARRILALERVQDPGNVGTLIRSAAGRSPVSNTGMRTAALQNAAALDAVGREFAGGLCVVIGSEGQGLTDAAVAACGRAVRIPMTDRAESLNAAVAGSVLLWHFRGV